MYLCVSIVNCFLFAITCNVKHMGPLAGHISGAKGPQETIPKYNQENRPPKPHL